MYTTYTVGQWKTSALNVLQTIPSFNRTFIGTRLFFCEWYIREQPTCVLNRVDRGMCVCVWVVFTSINISTTRHIQAVLFILLFCIWFVFCVCHSHSIPNRLCMYYHMSIAWNFVDKHTDTRIIENRIHSKPLLHIRCFGYSWIFGYCRQTCTTITARRALTHTHMHPLDIWLL